MFFSKRVKVGTSVLRVPRDMAWCFADGEYYEKNVVYWVGRILGSCTEPVLYDIGANYGYFSVRFAQHCSAIYAFEPVSKTFSVLESNLKRNRLSNVKQFQVGLSDSESAISINLYSSSGNNSIYRRALPPNHPLREIGQETIKVVRLDHFLAQNPLRPPDLMKIDVEGAELYALQGAQEVLARFRPFLCLEYSDSTSNDAGYAKELLLHELHRYDYEIVGLSEDADDLGLIPEADFSTSTVANIIAVPKGKSLGLER